MGAVKNYDDFINRIRSLDISLEKMRVRNIEIDKKTRCVTYVFICDKTVSEELKQKIADCVDDMTSRTFLKVHIKVDKIVSDPELINFKILEYVRINHPSVSIFLSSEDVESRVEGDKIFYKIKLTEGFVDTFRTHGGLKNLDRYLSTEFCSDVIGAVESKKDEELPDLTQEEVYISELQKVSYRTINVSDIVVIDDIYMPSVARYIEDIEDGSNTVCGTIIRINEKVTAKGKPYFVLTIDDTTKMLSGVYFSKKNTLDKIRDLKEGDTIISSGVYGEYRDSKSFTFEKINRCSFPSDFIKEKKPGKVAPRNYSLIFPEKATVIKADTVFSKQEFTPKVLMENDYVVFDLETTGLDPQSDYITEIGAVKIKKGKIEEQFTTLLSVPIPVPEKIVSLTGITDELLENKPTIEQVFPDFMKFIDGTILVVHNAGFDPLFIRRIARQEDYEFINKVLDTIAISKQQLPSLRKYDLHTLADHFGIVFHHHRALSDAYATAEAFIELMRLNEMKNK
ncbi:MAG: hypothetical protein MJ066_02140 [Clostridia bacterium]|nr:hypothetical protein [Clostridia bacterium]